VDTRQLGQHCRGQETRKRFGFWRSSLDRE
jgi:hypothetical protein